MAKYLNFKLEGIIFAIPVDYVFEVTKYQKLRAIPGVNSNIEGLINLRGSVIPVLNLKKILNLCETEKPKDLIFIEINSTQVALAVDEIIGLMVAEDNDIDKNLSWQVFMDKDIVQGIVKKQELVAILNVEKLWNK